jgi:hypothetical protein
MGIVLEPSCVAHLVEQLSRALCHASHRNSGFAQGVRL